MILILILIWLVTVPLIIIQLVKVEKNKKIESESGELLGSFQHYSYMPHLHVIYPLISGKLSYAFLGMTFYFLISITPVIILFFIIYFRLTTEIKMYDKGISIMGNFLEWHEVMKIYKEKDRIEIITSKKNTRDFLITKIVKVGDFYRLMISKTPHLNCT